MTYISFAVAIVIILSIVILAMMLVGMYQRHMNKNREAKEKEELITFDNCLYRNKKYIARIYLRQSTEYYYHTFIECFIDDEKSNGCLYSRKFTVADCDFDKQNTILYKAYVESTFRYYGRFLDVQEAAKQERKNKDNLMIIYDIDENEGGKNE